MAAGFSASSFGVSLTVMRAVFGLERDILGQLAVRQWLLSAPSSSGEADQPQRSDEDAPSPSYSRPRASPSAHPQKAL